MYAKTVSEYVLLRCVSVIVLMVDGSAVHPRL